MKRINILYRIVVFLLVLTFNYSCEKDNKEGDELTVETLEGFVQKGPYVNGTSITVSELSRNLTATGRNFNTQIVDNKGSFEILDIILLSKYVELKADGFYYNEINGETSPAQLTLMALSNLGDRHSINVNLMTHLEKSRVEYLIGEGKEFDEAKAQAQSEILSVFGFSEIVDINSENLDISMSGEDNAVLLAISCILQAQRSVGDLTELLANISTDLRTDGELNSSITYDTLYEGAYKLNYQTIRENLENRYNQLGVAAVIPPFEKYIDDFLNPFEITTNITPVACNGASSGAIDLSVSGGTEPYSFIWSNGAISEDVTGLDVGMYSVKITDANNFRWTLDSLIVSGADGLTVHSTLIHNSSTDGGNGSISITVEGGTSPYGYSWSDEVTDKDRSGLEEGKYILTVTDANECMVVYEYQIKTYEFISDARDGNVYPIVKLGEDWWMAKNLDFRSDESSYLDNDSLKYASQYGRLYTFPVSSEVCPSGWHIPTVSEVDELLLVLGDDTGVRLLNESQDIPPWWDDALEVLDQSHLNSSGISALLGYRSDHSDEYSDFWVQESGSISGLEIRVHSSYEFGADYTDEREIAFPVRCVKDR